MKFYEIIIYFFKRRNSFYTIINNSLKNKYSDYNRKCFFLFQRRDYDNFYIILQFNLKEKRYLYNYYL